MYISHAIIASIGFFHSYLLWDPVKPIMSEIQVKKAITEQNLRWNFSQIVVSNGQSCTNISGGFSGVKFLDLAYLSTRSLMSIISSAGKT